MSAGVRLLGVSLAVAFGRPQPFFRVGTLLCPKPGRGVSPRAGLFSTRGGWNAARSAATPISPEEDALYSGNPKDVLHRYCGAGGEGRPPPKFEFTFVGPKLRPTVRCQCKVPAPATRGGPREICGRGEGSNKKSASAASALDACIQLHRMGALSKSLLCKGKVAVNHVEVSPGLRLKLQSVLRELPRLSEQQSQIAGEVEKKPLCDLLPAYEDLPDPAHWASRSAAALRQWNATRAKPPPGFAKLQEYRRGLPSFSCLRDIVDLVQQHRVVVISGETGCGKTTQVP
eukprot:RCo002714